MGSLRSKVAELMRSGPTVMASKSPEALAKAWDAVEERFELNPHEHGDSYIVSHHVPRVSDIPDSEEMYTATSPDSKKCLGCAALASASPKKLFVSASVIGGSQHAWLGATSIEVFRRLRRVNDSLSFTVGPTPIIFISSAPGGTALRMLVAGMHPGQYLQHWQWGERRLTFVFGNNFLHRGGLATPGPIPILLLSGMLWIDAVARGRSEKKPPFRVSVGEKLTLKMLGEEVEEVKKTTETAAKRIGSQLWARGFEVKFTGVGELQWRPGWHQTFIPEAGVMVGEGSDGVTNHLKRAFLKWFSEQYMEDEHGVDAPKLVRAQPCKDGWYQVEEE